MKNKPEVINNELAEALAATYYSATRQKNSPLKRVSGLKAKDHISNVFERTAKHILPGITSIPASDITNPYYNFNGLDIDEYKHIVAGPSLDYDRTEAHYLNTSLRGSFYKSAVGLISAQNIISKYDIYDANIDFDELFKATDMYSKFESNANRRLDALYSSIGVGLESRKTVKELETIAVDNNFYNIAAVPALLFTGKNVSQDSMIFLIGKLADKKLSKKNAVDVNFDL